MQKWVERGHTGPSAVSSARTCQWESRSTWISAQSCRSLYAGRPRLSGPWRIGGVNGGTKDGWNGSHLSSGVPGMVLSRKNPSTPPTNIEVSRRTCIDIIMAYDWQLNAFHNSNWCPNIIADSSEGYLQYLINLGNCGDDESWVFLHPLGQHLKMGSLLLV